MKERPILFSAPMVRAIIEWRKTMTRRVVNPQPVATPSGISWNGWDFPDAGNMGTTAHCPHGTHGDRLWVKEAHFLYGYWGKNGKSKTGRQKWKFYSDKTAGVKFLDNPPEKIISNKLRGTGWCKRNSLFMPRWASRITLEITGVKVERLQDISEENARTEGCLNDVVLVKDDHGRDVDYRGLYAKERFQDLWESLNGPGSWDVNPWVWVISFRRI